MTHADILKLFLPYLCSVNDSGPGDISIETSAPREKCENARLHLDAMLPVGVTYKISRIGQENEPYIKSSPEQMSRPFHSMSKSSALCSEYDVALAGMMREDKRLEDVAIAKALKDMSFQYPAAQPMNHFPALPPKSYDFTFEMPQLPGSSPSSKYPGAAAVAPSPRYDKTDSQNWDDLANKHRLLQEQYSSIHRELETCKDYLQEQIDRNTNLVNEKRKLERSNKNIVISDKMMSGIQAADRAFRFFAGINMQDHPRAEQNEYVVVMRELGSALQGVTGHQEKQAPKAGSMTSGGWKCLGDNSGAWTAPIAPTTLPSFSTTIPTRK